jgi:hypothetical protein
VNWTNSHLHRFKIGDPLYGDPMLLPPLALVAIPKWSTAHYQTTGKLLTRKPGLMADDTPSQLVADLPKKVLAPFNLALVLDSLGREPLHRTQDATGLLCLSQDGLNRVGRGAEDAAHFRVSGTVATSASWMSSTDLMKWSGPG